MIEADFQREYGMDLMQEIKSGLSWRRFTNLLGNLGPNSVLVNVLSTDSGNETLESQDEIESFLEGF